WGARALAAAVRRAVPERGPFRRLPGGRALRCTMRHGLHPLAHSSGCSCHSLELNQPADVVAEVHHADLESRSRDADGAHDLAAHRVLLLAEYVLDTGAHLRARRVRRLQSL